MSDRNPALRFMHHWPTRILCVLLIAVQSASLNWYLMDNLSLKWAGIFGADAVVVCLFITAMVMSTTIIHEEKRFSHVTYDDVRYQPLTFIAWFVYAIVIDIKIGVIFTQFSDDLDEDSFFGPNTLKSTLALSGLVFLTFLATQHDQKHGDRKDLILSLTGFVIFDILDGVDSMENLFDKEARESYPPGLDDTVIGVCCINFILPGVPFLTLAFTKFGLRKVPKKLELLHKLAVAYAVNLPLFITRMITWHGLSQGISIFALKNLIAMGTTAFELLEHHFTQDTGQESAKLDNLNSSSVRNSKMVDSSL